MHGAVKGGEWPGGAGRRRADSPRACRIHKGLAGALLAATLLALPATAQPRNKLSDPVAEAPPGAHAERERILTRLHRLDPSYAITAAGSRRSGEPNDLLRDPLNQMKLRLALHTALLTLSNGDGVYGSLAATAFWTPWNALAATIETTWQPQISLITRPALWRGGDPSQARLALRASFLHSSDGKNGNASRSWNRATVGAEWGRAESDPLTLRLTGWYPFAVQQYYSKLPDVAGHGELQVLWQPLIARGGAADLLGLAAALRMSLSGRGISHLVVNLSGDPFRRYGPPWDALPTLYLQFFSGSGEGLHLDGRDTHALRLGALFYPSL